MSRPLLKELYLGAAEMIKDPSKWTWDYEDLDDKVCALGAIYRVGSERGLSRPDFRKIVRDHFIITTINDFLGRKAVIVYLRFRASRL